MAGQHVGSELIGIALEKSQLLLGQLQAGDLVRRRCPAATGGALGNHQSSQLMEQVIVQGVGVGLGVNFVQVAIAPGGTPGRLLEVVADPDHVAGIDVILHSLGTHGGEGFAIVVDALHQILGLIQGVQGEGVHLAGAVLVAIKDSVQITGKRVGVET